MTPSADNPQDERRARAYARARAHARSTSIEESKTASDERATSADGDADPVHVRALEHGWQAARCAPDSHAHPDDARVLEWLPARVPGTAAAALAQAGAWSPGEAHDFDAEDWWFRTEFDGPADASDDTPARTLLHVGGIATVAEVYLNGERLLTSESMFERHALEVGARVGARNELAIRCRALAPLLQQRRRPRARWRTRLVADGNLRFFRTMLLGRAPGFAPGPAAVGPWRAVSLERRRGIALEDVRVRSELHGRTGRVRVSALLRTLDGEPPADVRLELSGPSGEHVAQLELQDLAPGEGARVVRAQGELSVPEAARWWPHTHGEPALHELRLRVIGAQVERVLELGRVGFRTIDAGAGRGIDLERDGLELRVNGARVFARGAVWTPVDFVSMAPSQLQLREALEQVRAAGLNILRIPGTSAYESEAFHDLCDELGVLVWQDLMFANMDYPLADEGFRAQVVREARQVLADLGGRASTAVLCGNSEIEQQVAMLGLDASLGRGELFGELLPALAADSELDVPYVPSAPCGGDQPFRPDRGVANYYGVGGYRRPLEDARRAGVRFAAECLALANVPCEETIAEMLPQAPANMVVHHPRWKAGVPRDAGCGWDFEDVRDHYLQLLFGLDAGELRRGDHERYLELSRLTSGEVMSEVLGEWRREASGCAGAMVLWLRDLLPGAGWGLIDSRGEPKVAYHHVRRACEPVALWLIDEGLGGLVAHVANDGREPLQARVRIAVYRDHEHLVEQAEREIELPAHAGAHWNVEELLGHFIDAGWAYRFGPPQHDVIVASLESREGELKAQAMRFPAGRPRRVEALARVGARASMTEMDGGRLRARVTALRLLYGVRFHVPGYRPLEDSFSLEPGTERVIDLHASAAAAAQPQGFLTAVNVSGRIPLAYEPERARLQRLAGEEAHA